MIHILHHQKDEIINWISHVKSDNHENSIENDEKYNFIVSVNEPGADDLGSRSRILIPGEEGDYREFIVDYTYERTAYLEKEVYTKGSFIDIKKTKYLSPQVLEGQTIQTAAGLVLSGYEWQVGIVEYSGIRKWVIESRLDAYEALKAIAALFECEMRFRVTVDGDQITGRYVDFIRKQGLNRGKETVFGKDLIGITRKVYSDRIITALQCYGPERQDGTRLEVLVTDDAAYQNWNRKGNHLIASYEPESTDSDMTIEQLTQLGETELKKRIAAAIEYELEAVSLEHIFGYEHEITRLGDSVKIKDEHFNPPMYLESRVIFVGRSVFDNSKKNYKLGEVIEYKEEDVMKTWRQLQAFYAAKVVKSPTPPLGKPNVLWVQTGKLPEIMYTWSEEVEEWVKATPTEAVEVGAETPEGAQAKANLAETNAKTYADSVSDEAYNDALSDAKTYANENSIMNGKTYNGVSISNTDGFLTVRGDELVRTVQNSTVGILIQTRASINDPWEDFFYADPQTRELILAGKIKSKDFDNFIQLTGNSLSAFYGAYATSGRTLLSIDDTIPTMFDGNEVNPKIQGYGKMYTQRVQVYVPARTWNPGEWIDTTVNINDHETVAIQVVSMIQCQSLAKEMYAYEKKDARVPTVGDLQSFGLRLSPNYTFTSAGFYADVDILIVGWR